MKPFLFGDPRADRWKLSLNEVSVEEGLVVLDGELCSGLFRAATPMHIPAPALAKFAADVRALDRTLTEAATLESAGPRDTVRWTVTVNRLGQAEARGRYETKGNGLDFQFKIDRGQVGLLLSWLDAVLKDYQTKAA